MSSHKHRPDDLGYAVDPGGTSHGKMTRERFDFLKVRNPNMLLRFQPVCVMCLGSGKTPRGRLGFARADEQYPRVITCARCEGYGREGAEP